MCRRDSFCKGVYDQYCDERYVHLCNVGIEYADDQHFGGCIYDKKGNFFISSNFSCIFKARRLLKFVNT